METSDGRLPRCPVRLLFTSIRSDPGSLTDPPGSRLQSPDCRSTMRRDLLESLIMKEQVSRRVILKHGDGLGVRRIHRGYRDIAGSGLDHLLENRQGARLEIGVAAVVGHLDRMRADREGQGCEARGAGPTERSRAQR
jgi:hypothetical protein